MISMTNVSKWFGSFQVLKTVNLEVKTGDRVVVCGPSGSGKSTLIRCINGLEDLQEGEITVNGILLTPLAVTKDNLNVIVDKGWITKAEVCGGVDPAKTPYCK